MISPDKAFREIMNMIEMSNKTESIDITDSINSILGETIIAKEDIPPFSKSLYDGYAIVAKETNQASYDFPLEFYVIDDIPAGYVSRVENGKSKREAVRIMTGAKIPEGYDAVVPHEQVMIQGNRVKLTFPLTPNQNIALKGREIKCGEKLFQPGVIITPHHIGVLASLGYSKLKVISPPKVGVITTGSELVDLHDPLTEGMIRNSNKYLLTSWLKQLGLTYKYIGGVRDSIFYLKEAISTAAFECDLVITSGGVSLGDYDLVPQVLDDMGGEILFWRVNMRPGTSIHAAKYQGIPVLSLSGNPPALTCSFKVLLEPALKKAKGRKIKGNNLLDHGHSSYLTTPLPKKNSTKWRFQLGRGELIEGKFYCTSSRKHRTGVASFLGGANGYIVIPPFQSPVLEGEVVTFIPFNNIITEE